MSNIRLAFEGMLVLFLNDGSRFCDVGVLKHVDHHEKQLLITRIPEGGAPVTMRHYHEADLKPKLWLDVEKSGGLKIELFKNPKYPVFERLKITDDETDFRWALDFEGLEMYKGRIGVERPKFEPVFRINDGKFFTQLKSTNQLTTKKGTAGKETTLGPVAVELRAEISLAGGDVAHFFNGDDDKDPVDFSHQPRTDYGVYLGHTPHRHLTEAEVPPIHAESYYSALAGDVAPSGKLHFERTAIRVTPDAACFVGWMSQSELPLA